MTLDALSSLVTRLRRHDTPTVCNAIEVAMGHRGFDGFTRRAMTWTGPPDARIVGVARTARIAGRTPPDAPPEEIRARRMDYFRAMANGPRPAVAVVEDIDGDAAMGAWWGEVHARVHREVFGLAGALTNGLVRDLGDLPAEFPVLAGSVGPSHGFVHVHDIGTDVCIFGMTVRDGDVVHADRHGAVAIPADVLDDLPDALDRLSAAEGILLDALDAGPVDFDAFQTLWTRFETART